MAPILITEVTRRVNLKDKWQAIYTSGKTLPTPFCRATYYHRSLNPKKLIDVKFSGLGPKQTLAMVKKLYNLPEEPTLKIRLMTKKDVFGVYELVNEGLS
jgi:glycylpeptide N-tetradecanoyltransferase